MRTDERSAEEKAIEQTLAGLRDVNTPIDLERRMLYAIRTRTRTQTQAVAPARKGVWQIFGMAAAAVVILSLAIHGRRSEPVPSRRTKPLSAQVRPVAIATPMPEPPEMPPKQQRSRPSALSMHMKPPVSYPAPEAPLSAEEKLLQQIARRGSEPQWRPLNAENRAKEDALQTAAFDEFIRGNP